MAMKSVKKNMINLNELREKATQIAIKVHKGQVDKGGHDYIYHPLRVEAKSNSFEEKIVALLHDTVEDGGIAAEYLLSRPLKTIFQYKVCIDKLYADSFYKVQKNSHSSFEVICCRS